MAKWRIRASMAVALGLVASAGWAAPPYAPTAQDTARAWSDQYANLQAVLAKMPTLNGDGGAQVHVTNFPATQPVSGTVSLGAGSANVGGVELLDAAGSNKAAVNGSGQVAVQLPPNAAQETGGNLATIVTNTTGLATAANQTTSQGSLSSIATNTGSGGALAYAAHQNPAVVLTRATGALTYTGGSAVNGSSAGYLTFPNVCRANGTSVLVTELKVIDGANQSLKFSGILFMFKSPPTPIADGQPWNLNATDQGNIVTQIPVNPAVVLNQNSGASGAVMDEETNLGRQVFCDTGSTTLYGELEVLNNYISVSAETWSFDPKVVGAN